MTSRRLMALGDSVIYSKNMDTSRNNISLMDKSLKTNSTYATPKRNNLKQLISSYSLSKKSSINKEKLITDINNLNSSNNISKINSMKTNYDLMNKIHTEQKKESKELINNADKIMKERRNNHLVLNYLVKSSYMKKMNEARLDNYKIKMLKNKRNELCTKILDINNAIKSTEKIFEKDYKNFLHFVDNNNKSQKYQEYILNEIKMENAKKESEYEKLNSINRKLINNIELLVKRILVLKNYGQFIHKVFKKDFIYEKIKKSEGKNYLDLANEFIMTYETEGRFECENKLMDEYWLLSQFNEFEIKVLNKLNEGDEFIKQHRKKENEDISDIIRLAIKKRELEKKLEKAMEENRNFIKTMKSYNSPDEIDTVLDSIEEITKIIGISNPSTNVLLKEKNEANYTVLCSDIINMLKEKEKIINHQIVEIESIENGENEEDKLIIEKIISERKKLVKKEKLMELIERQKEEIAKKNKKSFERAHRIVIKGRKVIDFPKIKYKKKKKIIVIENHDDDFLVYSSEEEK